MEYRIVVDSCGELTDEMKKSGIYKTASLSMEVDGVHIQDDESFDQADFLKRVAESSECPKSSCPSPEKYMELYHCEAERVYAVTLSAELSGSHNSAELGRKLYEEEYGRKQIHVFNSRSASVGESLIALKIQECEEKGMEFEEVIASVDRYIEENGRLTGLKSLAVSALNIKPVMGANPEGQICQLGQGRGMKKALAKMAEQIAADAINPTEKILAISHCNCPERAMAVEKLIREKINVKESFIVDTAGISSMYANDGGIIVVL